MGEPSLLKWARIQRLPVWCTSRRTCQTLERTRRTTESASRVISPSLVRSRRRQTVSLTSTPRQFHEYFAADLSAEQAAFMARSQVLNAADNFKTAITTPAWRSKPSWMLVAAKDRTINPDLERWYAKRAHSHKVEVAGARHSVYVSHPKEVADVIKSAARAVSK